MWNWIDADTDFVMEKTKYSPFKDRTYPVNYYAAGYERGFKLGLILASAIWLFWLIIVRCF